jgi:putative serine protease PepD
MGSRVSLSIVVLAFAIALTANACGETKNETAAKMATVTVRPVALPAHPKAVTSTDAAASLQTLFVRVVRNVAPSVVQIETSSGLGSGLVYDRKGDIVTNAHVVQGAKKFRVTFANGKQRPATLVGTFAPNDLAVVHVDGRTPAPAQFGHSAALAVGDIVLAIGNPLGLRSSVTQGIVSSLGRTVSEGNGVALASVIQTSAAINPGNSGGALVDLESEVIGIPTLAALDPEFGQTPAPGIGFAIPSDTVRLIADQLIKTGNVSQSGRAYLGVTVASLIGGGVVVVQVDDGGPAAAAGMTKGDRIVSLDGTPITNTDELATVLAETKPGRTVPVEVERSSKKLTLHVSLGELKSR